LGYGRSDRNEITLPPTSTRTVILGRTYADGTEQDYKAVNALQFGVLVPLTLQRFGADPCTASSIFLTTGTDIASMGLMLGLATVLVL
jgi:hypothetical protein